MDQATAAAQSGTAATEETPLAGTSPTSPVRRRGRQKGSGRKNLTPADIQAAAERLAVEERDRRDKAEERAARKAASYEGRKLKARRNYYFKHPAYARPPAATSEELLASLQRLGLETQFPPARVGEPPAPFFCITAPQSSVVQQAAVRLTEGLLGHRVRKWKAMPLYPKQQAFVDSNEVFRGFVGGRGCGKSKSLMYDLLCRAKPGRLYMVIGPTYRSLVDTTYRTFLEVAGPSGLDCIVRENKTNFSVVVSTRDGGEAQINFRSADDPERLRGPNLSGAVFDEASLMVEEAFTIVIACLREAGEMGWMSLGFTPKGKIHWTYKTFYDVHGNQKSDTFLVRAGTRENYFLSPKFVQVMEDKYVAGSTIARQELDGEFVDLSGLLFQRSWFKACTSVPYDAVRVRYWDKAGTEGDGDYSAGVLVARVRNPTGTFGAFYIEDVVRGQWSPAERNKIIRDTAARDARRYKNQVSVWIEQEPGSGGKESALLSMQELAEYPVYIDRVSGQGNKEVRARPLRSQAEVGNVYAREGKWLESFLDEVCSFDGEKSSGKHDDQVDAASGAYNKVAMMTGLMLDTSRPMIAYPEKPAEALAARLGGGGGNDNGNGQAGPVSDCGSDDNGNHGEDLIEWLVRYGGGGRPAANGGDRADGSGGSNGNGSGRHSTRGGQSAASAETPAEVGTATAEEVTESNTITAFLAGLVPESNGSGNGNGRGHGRMNGNRNGNGHPIYTPPHAPRRRAVDRYAGWLNGED